MLVFQSTSIDEREKQRKETSDDISPFNFISFIFPYFISFPSVRQIIISLSARPRKISSTPERSVRVIRIRQSFHSPLRTNSTDTLTTPRDGIGLEDCNVSIHFIMLAGRSL